MHRAHVDDAAALAAYMCVRQARVVRNAPSRWIASIFFQSANGKSSIGCDDLDAGIADQDVDAAVLLDASATPASTCASSVTSMATPKASPSARADLGGRRLGRVQVEVGDHHLGALGGEGAAISLPMPLAAPVTMATLSFRCMTASCHL